MQRHEGGRQQQTGYALPLPPAGDYRVLIVSDVAARGLDIPDCDAVFHLELPTDAAHYAHRAGRTGRCARAVSHAGGSEACTCQWLAR